MGSMRARPQYDDGMAVRRTISDRELSKGAAGAKAKTVGGPLPSKPDRQLAGLTAQQVIAEVMRRQDVAIGNMYAMALCLRELSRPERYRDELKFRSFEALLAAHAELPSRMTCHKYFTVVSVFSEAEVKRLGGMEKCYELIRSQRQTNPKGDPRALLKTDARVLGVRVNEVSARGLRELLRGRTQHPKVSTEGAKRVARRLRTAFRRLLVDARLRVHTHDGAACVETHFPVKGATDLVPILKSAVAPPAT